MRPVCIALEKLLLEKILSLGFFGLLFTSGFFNGGDIAPQGAIRGDLNNLKNWGAILNNWGAISQLKILL